MRLRCYFSALLFLGLASLSAGPLKVFILSGQSNMVGEGQLEGNTPGHLVNVVKNAQWAHLRNGSQWAVRNDVAIWNHGAKGPLTVGYGATQSYFGPELQFGNVIGDHYGDPVFLLKLSWGSLSLAVDYRPPSSGGTTGHFYNEVVNTINDFKSNPGKYATNYDPAQGFEIVGFGWHQGWSERIHPNWAAEYEANMVNFIKDIRRDICEPDLRFVITTTGHGGWDETDPNAIPLINQQMAVADYSRHPEFRGNVDIDDTRDYWRPVNVSPKDEIYHWNENAESYVLIGHGIAQKMLPLLPSGSSKTMPNVVGMSLVDASNAISSAGLIVEKVTSEFSNTVPAGEVISQCEMAGARVYTGSRVYLHISLGAEGSDNHPPYPNRAMFAVAPFAPSTSKAIMLATEGTDANGPVEYLFTETSGNPGGTSSGWQSSPSYTDTGLNPSKTYTYTVTMRDSLGNVGTASVPMSVKPDLDPPTPNAATFDTEPYATGSSTVSMRATVGMDANVPISYKFTEITGNPGSRSSGWQQNPLFEATGLNPATSYRYTVTMRDALGNTGTASSALWVTTLGADTTPPNPNPMTWVVPPSRNGLTDTEITMTASTATDSNGVEYYFDETSGNSGGTDSGWQDSPTYIDTGLTKGVTYTYTVKARDKSDDRNETNASIAASAVAGFDSTPPTPNPAGFVALPAAVNGTEIRMTAITGSDESGPVEYYFTESSGNPGGSDSGWQTSPSYADTGLSGETQYSYTVKMRDSLGNVGSPSAVASASTSIDRDLTPPSPNPMTFMVEPVASSVSVGDVDYIQISSDADSGINTSKTYTHAVDFGTEAATVNGVVFANDMGQVAGGRANAGTRTYGHDQHVGWGEPAVTGDVATVFRDMVYAGLSGEYIELEGLTPGQWYQIKFFQRAWGYQSNRRTFHIDYDLGSDGSTEYSTPKIDQNDATLSPVSLSGNVSFVVAYTYQADSSGKLKATIRFADDFEGGHHLYGMTNEVVEHERDSENRILMVATNAIDESGVEYYFEETSGNAGGSNSGWQDSPSFIDTGLSAGTTYSYRVKARDKSDDQNETAYSSVISATTDTSFVDTEPPSPNPASFSSAPAATSDTSITMTATAGTDVSGVQYRFIETSGNSGGTSSGWQNSASLHRQWP